LLIVPVVRDELHQRIEICPGHGSSAQRFFFPTAQACHVAGASGAKQERPCDLEGYGVIPNGVAIGLGDAKAYGNIWTPPVRLQENASSRDKGGQKEPPKTGQATTGM
jgi:hypothetical protein